MECVISNQGHEIQARLVGQFTFADNQKFKRIMEALDAGVPKSFELHLAAVDFIDSAGLGMLLLLRDRCQSKNIALSIHSARGQVEKIFMISKFDQLFTLHS